MNFTELSKYLGNIGGALYTYLIDNIPASLLLEPGKKWWQIALIILFYVVLYEIAAYGILVFFMSILRKFSALMRKYNCNLFCWWQHLIYIVSIVICLSSSDDPSGYIKANFFSLSLFSIVIIYFIVKSQWRFLYFPLMQLYLWVFIGLTISLLLPAIILFIFLNSLPKKSVSAKKTCRYCGKSIENGEKCKCGIWVI